MAIKKVIEDALVETAPAPSFKPIMVESAFLHSPVEGWTGGCEKSFNNSRMPGLKLYLLTPNGPLLVKYKEHKQLLIPEAHIKNYVLEKGIL